jgi:hypothetical protein
MRKISNFLLPVLLLLMSIGLLLSAGAQIFKLSGGKPDLLPARRIGPAGEQPERRSGEGDRTKKQ